MEAAEIRSIVVRQRACFQSAATLPVEARLDALKKLRTAMEKYQDKVHQALMEDLKKCELESFMCETGLALSELNFVEKHLRRWARDRRVPTPLSNFAARSFIRPMPYGVTLIMSPWNYPYLLSVEPMIAAIAAGNTVVLKPSAYAPATSAVLQEMLSSALPEELCAVVTGGREENQNLLAEKFDYIFFTGSQAVGKEVMRKAAEHLTPVTLELGGKSPVIVDATAKIPLAARRIVFGKFLNSGQTCVAPDYVLCEKAVKDDLIQALVSEIRQQIGEKPFENPDYSRMISRKHFDRVLGLIRPEQTAYGGQSDPNTLQIAPTILDGVSPEDPVMQEEIFGPVLPVLTIEKAEDAVDFINQRNRPLALYVFSQDRGIQKKLTTECAFGGGCINDTIIHLATSNMPFGGMGESGMGSYHGRYGFDTFSHFKSIVDKKTWIDLSLRYRPYTASGKKLIQTFLK